MWVLGSFWVRRKSVAAFKFLIFPVDSWVVYGLFLYIGFSRMIIISFCWFFVSFGWIRCSSKFWDRRLLPEFDKTIELVLFSVGWRQSWVIDAIWNETVLKNKSKMCFLEPNRASSELLTSPDLAELSGGTGLFLATRFGPIPYPAAPI